MTVKRALSYSKWRSIRGRVPRPMEPKPIITMGPVIRPWTGQEVAASVMGRVILLNGYRGRRTATAGLRRPT